MLISSHRISAIGIALFLLLSTSLSAQEIYDPKNTEIAMRLLGHSLLQSAGDSTSKVLPIVKESVNEYRIKFDSDFLFVPDSLVNISQYVAYSYNLPARYRVEVQECGSLATVYVFSVSKSTPKDLLPCLGREQTPGCYEILFTILEEPNKITANQIIEVQDESKSININYLWLLLIFPIYFIYQLIKSRKSTKNHNKEGIEIGSYLFDPINMTLSMPSIIEELTSKEADLLNLLYKSVNEKVERSTILNSVWGDEGDYIGRTLDVFISKLRKKLSHDPNVKIVNIRGVGYKLIVNKNPQ